MAWKTVLATLLLVLTASVSFGAHAVFITKIVNGDTLVVSDKGTNVIVRMYGIDAPDEGQFGYETSKNALTDLLKGGGGVILLDTIGTVDRFGRTIGILIYDGKCINKEMVARGLAFVDPATCLENECMEWLQLQSAAKQQHVGLWTELLEEMPWVYRNAHDRLFRKKEEGYIEGVQYIVKGKTVTASVPELPREKFKIYPIPIYVIHENTGPVFNINQTQINQDNSRR